MNDGRALGRFAALPLRACLHLQEQSYDYCELSMQDPAGELSGPSRTISTPSLVLLAGSIPYCATTMGIVLQLICGLENTAAPRGFAGQAALSEVLPFAPASQIAGMQAIKQQAARASICSTCCSISSHQLKSKLSRAVVFFFSTNKNRRKDGCQRTETSQGRIHIPISNLLF